MDSIVLFIGEYGYLLAIALLIFKVLHYFSQSRRSFRSFLLFSSESIQFSKQSSRKNFKQLQNSLTISIIALALLILILHVIVLDKDNNNKNGVEVPDVQTSN